MSQHKDITRREFVQMGGAAALTLGAPAAAGALTGKETTGEEVLRSPQARNSWDLGQLKWQLSGFIPYLWAMNKYTDIHKAPAAEVGPIDAAVPGSVQKALLDAGVIPDWNVALNSRQAEWVENRDWIYQTQLPDEWIREGKQLRLRCAGLDYAGSILLNGVPILDFKGSFTPYEVDLKPHLKPSGNLLQIWFQQSPRWLGQIGYTSQMKEWKPRFNYGWDWIVRLVQIGIWGPITLDALDGAGIADVRCLAGASPASGTGSLRVTAATMGGAFLHFALSDGQRAIREETVPAGASTANVSWDWREAVRVWQPAIPLGAGASEISWNHLPVDLWWPNGMGKQPLYTLRIRLLDNQKRQIDSRTLRVGFRHIEWKFTQGAAPDTQPFLCAVNGKEVFLFGINWTPIRPNFADLREQDYRKRIAVYRDTGMNVIRVWGGGFPERQWLFDQCDQNGILVWQDFPLSSSGLDNDPPGDESSINQQAEFARSYIRRLHHHASLAVWCGGNELQDERAGHPSAAPSLTIAQHPMVVRLAEVVRQNDPGRYFVPTAPYGPVFSFTPQTLGQHKHWDVHGPYTIDGPVDGAWRNLWQRDDAMFHSEMGAPSASSAAIIRRYKGDLPATPGTHANPLWNRQPWWIEWPEFVKEKGREPESLEEFVAWSQKRQSDALTLAVSAAKKRFPACGGIIIWMGHDCFPCTSNTAIVDFDGDPKPAALALKALFT